MAGPASGPGAYTVIIGFVLLDTLVDGVSPRRNPMIDKPERRNSFGRS